MADIIITGASGGIGRALALALAADPAHRLVLAGRDRARLDALAGEIGRLGERAVAVQGELSTPAEARALGERLAEVVERGATLVHNAGVWPHRRELTADGVEAAFAINHLAPLALQWPLLRAGVLDRILAIGAGLMVKGRFDAERTPAGADFGGVRTYCTTKLAFALGMRDTAAAHPETDVLVVHPGVVRTALGDRPGPIGWLLSRVKRGWEAPETCAARLVRILALPRWSPPGEAAWMEEETPKPWPAATEDPATRDAVRDVTTRLLAGLPPRERAPSPKDSSLPEKQ
jgi:NAD(P)-dependent dehydrogenase (short-subunit alcohol dehydrogenase family)